MWRSYFTKTTSRRHCDVTMVLSSYVIWNDFQKVPSRLDYFAEKENVIYMKLGVQGMATLPNWIDASFVNVSRQYVIKWQFMIWNI